MCKQIHFYNYLELVLLFIFTFFLFIFSPKPTLAAGDSPSTYSEAQAPILYTYTPDGQLNITLSLDDTNTLNLVFDSVGVNSIFALSSLQYVDQGVEEESMASSTDWVGPYIVMTSQDPSLPILDSRFTGGWHGSNGDDTGDPTAHTSGLQITVDQRLLTQNQSGTAYSMTIQVTNQIEAYNSNFPVLKEVTSYSLDGSSKISVSNQIEALSYVKILRYYGLQSQNNYWDGTVSYHYQGQDTDTTYPQAQDSQAQTKKEALVDYFELMTANQEHSLKVGIDPLGLGKFDYVSDDLPTAFSAYYSKSYFNLVNGIPLVLNKGDSVSWSGYYEFH